MRDRESRRMTFAKGRVALHAILEALEVGPGDQVLMPGYTCVVVPNAVRYRGAEPVFLDIDPATYNLDPKVMAASRGNGWDPERARAVILQHSYGIPGEFDAIAKQATADGLVVIEDSCHALASTYRGRPVGSLGEAAFFSSQWSKPLTTGLGGWAVAREPELESALRAVWERNQPPPRSASLVQLAQYAAYAVAFRPSLFWPARDLYRWLSERGLLVGSSSEEDFQEAMPREYRRKMSTWQQVLLDRKLQGFGRQVAHVRRLTAIYEDALHEAGRPGLELPDHLDPVLLRYPLRVPDKVEMLDRARRERIELGDWFVSPIHPIETGWAEYGYEEGSCPEGERASREVVNLSLHAKLKERDAERVARFVTEQLGR